ncbi:carbohydrate ABC transporter permease [Isoptericola cucumis]|uniref:Sugar ABC transporter permease n=1 Tax=Isoptericola cucumis TaxID=1776856 RepID=A0ABQ2B2G7_9MICO|nr:carbohydrate ABC transporter permease [Isoptericola cucumis]GGI06301.1 sugar ABC transporter permease [Isoptericola cucumis]
MSAAAPALADAGARPDGAAPGAPAGGGPRRAVRPRRDTVESTVGSRVLVTGVLVLTSVYFLLPLWWLLVAATKDAGHTFAGSPLWFSHFDLFGNIADLFAYKGGIFALWLGNAGLYSIVGAGVGTLVAAATGYAVAKYEFPGRRTLFAVVLGAVLVPKVLFTLPLFLMFSQVGIVNTYLAVLLPSIVSPFGVYLARIFAASSVPDEVIEAARLDGANEGRIFFRVSLRMMSPALVTIFLFQFVEIWNNFLLPSQVLIDEQLKPVTVGLVSWNALVQSGQIERHMVLVGAFVAVVPLIVAFLSLQRFWRSGLATGAVK